MKTQILCLLLSLAPFVSAHASPAIIQDFRRSAKVLPAKAMNYNYRRFGDVDLGQVYNSIDSLNVRVVGKVDRKQKLGPFDMQRDGAEWERGKGISLNGSRWPRMKADSKPMLSLHETFGILGISDDNFGCSGTIWALTNEEFRRSLTDAEIKRFEGFAEAACRSAGGSTVVGGGGDEFNVQVRMLAIKNSVKEMASARSEQERDHALGMGAQLMYQEWGRGRKGSINLKKMGSQVEIPPVVIGTIRVMKNGVQIPEDSRNGWTYDERTSVITFHGAAAIPTKIMGGTMGPEIYYKRLER